MRNDEKMERIFDMDDDVRALPERVRKEGDGFRASDRDERGGRAGDGDGGAGGRADG